MRIPTLTRSFDSILTLGVTACAFAAPLQGQIYPVAPVQETEFLIQVEHPFLPGDEPFGALTSVWELDLVTPLSDGVSLAIGAPFALATADDMDASLVLGNLSASLLFGQPDNARGFLGITVPTTTAVTDAGYATFVGLATRFDRLEEWADEAVALRGGIIRSRDAGAGRVGLRVGGAVVAETDFDDADFWARAAAFARAPAGSATLHGQLSGAWIVNEDDGLGRNSVVYFDAGADFDDIAGRPGVFIRVPLDEDGRDVLDLSLGVRLRL